MSQMLDKRINGEMEKKLVMFNLTILTFRAMLFYMGYGNTTVKVSRQKAMLHSKMI